MCFSITTFSMHCSAPSGSIDSAARKNGDDLTKAMYLLRGILV